jgi:type I restriction enzyme M protein
MTPPASTAPTTSRSKLAGTIKSARDIMRKDAGLNGDLDRLPQLSWLLFLKAFDERVEKVGAALNSSYRPAIEDKYAWDSWAGNPDFTGPDLLTFVDDDLLPYLRELAGEGPNDPRNVISTVFKEIHNRMLSGVLLRDLVNTVDSIGFESSDDIHTMAFVYESILKEMRDAAGDSGEFYTPRSVIRFMVQQSFLKLGEAILDPACGTGGFLAQAYEDLQPLADSTVKRGQLHHNLRGIEKKSLPYLFGSMNLLLHSIETPRLVRDNALIRMRTENQQAHRVNVVVTNPPFGGEEEESVVKLFPKPFQTQETAWLFVYSILDMLKRGGRCAIVLPNGSLFGGGVGARVKEKLLKECNLHTIVRLPQGVFAPYTQIPANLLFFEKTGPTRDIWFYQIPAPEGRRGHTKTKPMRFEEFDSCVQWWGGKDREAREAGEHAWMVPASTVKTKGFNLDIPNPRIGDELAHRSPKELIEDLVKTEKEILGLLEGLRSQVGNI